ncbi:Uncharacterised protein [Mycobacteroides abscessus]|nr:Uncharacterised protein [Mycobacteroides abscessus]
MSTPARRTSCESSSISRSAKRRTASSTGSACVRRSTARMRATTSSRLKGFVT